MKKYFSAAKFAAVLTAVLLTACASDPSEASEMTSGTTINALAELLSDSAITSAELPADTNPETTAAASEYSSGTAVTTIYVPDGNHTEDTAVSSAGRIPRQTETAEIGTTVVFTSENSQTDDDSWQGLNSWNTTAKTPEDAEKAANNAETSEFSVRIISVFGNYIFAEVISEEWFDILGSFVQINTSRLENVPECSAGDYAEITTGEEIGITEAYPPKLDEGVSGIKITRSLGIELTENSKIARVVSCNKVPSGEYYAIVVQTFNLRGYGFETEISMRSKEEFSFGDWVKITFADDAEFMESYPLQVVEQDVLGIEKI